MSRNKTEDKKKQKIINNHKKTLSTQIQERTTSKAKLKDIKDKIGDAITYIDKDNTVSQNELDLVIKYEDKLLGLDDEHWEIYEKISIHSMKSEPTVKNFTLDVESIENNIFPLVNCRVTSKTT